METAHLSLPYRTFLRAGERKAAEEISEVSLWNYFVFTN